MGKNHPEVKILYNSTCNLSTINTKIFIFFQNVNRKELKFQKTSKNRQRIETRLLQFSQPVIHLRYTQWTKNVIGSVQNLINIFQIYFILPQLYSLI